MAVRLDFLNSANQIMSFLWLQLHPNSSSFYSVFLCKRGLNTVYNIFFLVFIVLFFLPTSPSYSEKKELPVLVIINFPMLTRVLTLNRYSKIIHWINKWTCKPGLKYSPSLLQTIVSNLPVLTPNIGQPLAPLGLAVRTCTSSAYHFGLARTRDLKLIRVWLPLFFL